MKSDLELWEKFLKWADKNGEKLEGRKTYEQIIKKLKKDRKK